MRDGDEAAATPRPVVRRLKRRVEFQAVGKAGRRVHSERMTVQGVRREADGLRVGLTVTKREGHATERNRLRRRLRAVVDRLAADPLAREPVDLVLLGRRAALHAPFEALVGDVQRALATLSQARPSKPRRSPTEPARSPDPR